MKNLSLTKGRKATKAERKAAGKEQAERRAATKFQLNLPKKPKPKALPRKPGKARDPGKVYSEAERQKLIESRADLPNEMDGSAQDK